MVDGDDPFKTQDATLIRPRPGAGKRGVSDVFAPRPAAAPPAPVSAPLPDAVQERLAIGLNPLVKAASALLRMAGHARAAGASFDVPDLRRQALDEVRRFEERARAAGIANEIVLSARYVLCATLDEAVLSTPWGSQSEWAQHPLLVALHREAWGGEKFFEMLDRLSTDPARYLDLMELQYVCLALGFTGKYHTMDRGQDRLAQVRAQLHRTIRDHRGAPPADLSLKWRGLQNRRNPLMRFLPWWVAATAALAVLVGAYALYRSRLADQAYPVHLALAQADVQDVQQVAPPPSEPTLKQLLADDERRGAVLVEEDGPRTTVTLLGTDFFASGSADLNPQYDPVLKSVAAALARVRGPVRVVGHTDDQPLRSFRYRDNFELSRERAMSVVSVLRETVTASRLTARGVGASQPKYPERARNRRVEILHVRGT
ncbi:MAG TPA: type IVB secretion system protein IcmH/DotU [Luteitalea sp.]|nr:type IVB secretion system protein IcmH/DotU [Luteitalea sp.]